MKFKIFLLVFATLLLQVSTLRLITHDVNKDKCFYFPLGYMQINRDFNFTVTSSWTDEQAAQLKSGTLNTSDFIHVQGWKPYQKPNDFFTYNSRFTKSILNKLIFVKNVLQGSDAPQFGLSTADLEFAFGSPSKAVLYKVPPGKILYTLRFQGDKKPVIGKQTILYRLIYSDQVQEMLNGFSSSIFQQNGNKKTTTLDVVSALNINPSVVENNVFWFLEHVLDLQRAVYDSTQVILDTSGAVMYQAFGVFIREGQQVLLGPINNGQPGVIQVVDNVKDRSSCIEESSIVVKASTKPQNFDRLIVQPLSGLQGLTFEATIPKLGDNDGPAVDEVE